MAKHSKNTYRGASSRRKKILVRRWTLVILILFILTGGIVLAAKIIFSGNDNKELPSASPTLPAISATDSPLASSAASIGPDKAVPSASPLGTAEAETLPEVSSSPEASLTAFASLDPNASTVPGTAVTASVELVSANLMDAVKKADGVKTAYLTFDDGPTKSVTPKILDTLRRYNIKATFFEIGSGIEANPDMARRVYDEGHLLANHSYAHNYKELYSTEEGFLDEILKTESIIRSVTGEEDIFKLFRFPGGSFKSDKDRWSSKKQQYKEVLKANGYVYCDWNSLNGDAEGGTKTKEQLVQGVKNSVGTQEDVVVLMHDAAAKSATADALPEICEYLISQGYEFRRLDEFDK